MSALPALNQWALTQWQDAFNAQPRSEAQLEAFKSFLEAGLPTTKSDAWKYTDLRRLVSKQFTLPTTASVAALTDLLSFENRIVFVDGVLTPLLASQLAPHLASSVIPAKAGIQVSAKIVDKMDSRLRGNDELPTIAIATPGHGSFSLLNSALSSSTVEINISSDTDVVEPIYIVHAWTTSAKNLMSHPRVTLKLASGSKATVIEHFIGANTDANFANSVLDIAIGENASLEHIRLQDDAVGNFNIANIHVNVQRGGSYINHHYVLGSSLGRTDLNIKLLGHDAAADLHGLILAQNTQHLDVFTSIEHQSPNTRSSEDYRGIADQRGRVVFRGKVIVAKDAQKTDAKQSSRNLLLSAQAEIDTRPELEIYANDVKCAHGATVGQLDATSLFYLRSRGIDATEARALLTHAFAAEVIERIPLAVVREHVLTRFMDRMRSPESAT